jgi:D-mannonate dehydratase
MSCAVVWIAVVTGVAGVCRADDIDPFIRDFNERVRPLHIRETEAAIEAIQTLLARQPKED